MHTLFVFHDLVGENCILTELHGEKKYNKMFILLVWFIFQFLHFAESINPKTTKEADALIHGYYLASRKARSQGDDPSNIPVTSLQTMYAHNVQMNSCIYLGISYL